MKELHEITGLIFSSKLFEHGSQSMDPKIFRKIATSARNKILTQYFDQLELKQFDEDTDLFFRPLSQSKQIFWQKHNSFLAVKMFSKLFTQHIG